MHRLTREVRFAINDFPTVIGGNNGYGGVPPLQGLGHYFTLRLSLLGYVDPVSAYLINIKRIDAVVRDLAISAVDAAVHQRGRPDTLIAYLHERLRSPGRWFDGISVDAVELALSPFLAYSALTSELPMVRLSQKFEFSATHRLHNPDLSEEENRETYGKCNNPHGHGHNYEVQVTLAGTPGETGLLIDVPAFERIVATAVINRFDHKNLNVELPEFHDVIPSVENIASTIFRLLKPPITDAGAKLASVTVWETPKTWCEYSE